jgi:hypothetical protein
MGERNTMAEPMEEVVQARYMHNMLRLLTWADAVRGTVDLTLSGAAQAVFARFHAAIEKRLGKSSDLGDEDLKAWGSKLPGRTLKLAMILHLLDYLGEASGDVSLRDDPLGDLIAFGEQLPTEITWGTMERAIKIAHFLIPHAIAAFESMLGGRTLTDAQRILAWANQAHHDEFSWRDARRAFSKAVQKSPECNARLGAALTLLLSMGKIEQKDVSQEQRKTGRPHSAVYTIVDEGQAD